MSNSTSHILIINFKNNVRDVEKEHIKPSNLKCKDTLHIMFKLPPSVYVNDRMND